MTSIAIDAMGGDFGEKPIIEGVIQALKEREFKAILVGDPQKLKTLIPQELNSYIEYEEAFDVFAMDENSTDALKRKD
ncbi:phosphate acyltransferase, partial [Campylobacter lari]